jgi:hypothetical protein
MNRIRSGLREAITVTGLIVTNAARVFKDEVQEEEPHGFRGLRREFVDCAFRIRA